jgi:predicted nucleic acid-binding protein
MNPAVLDASVILRWAFDDETDREGAVSIAESLQAGSLLASAPPSFLLEVAAALVVAMRGDRISRETADVIMGALSVIAIDETNPHRFAEDAMDVALRAGVRVPDAAYLETARRSESTLITADRAQLAGALRLGLATLPLSEVPARDT